MVFSQSNFHLAHYNPLWPEALYCIESAGKRQNSMVIGYIPCLCSFKTGVTTNQFNKQCRSLGDPTLV